MVLLARGGIFLPAGIVLFGKGDTNNVSVGVVIPAAGLGKRMGTKESKQFLELDGQPILLHTLFLFEQHPEITEIVLAVREEEQERVLQMVTDAGIRKATKIVVGGKERQDSVYQGLLACESEYVLVHDAVRPFVEPELLQQLIAVVREKEAAVLAVPSKDTIKEVHEGVVTNTPERAFLWNVQTPQAFRRSLLIEANHHAEQQQLAVTDDASIVEYYGYPVTVVMGNYHNIKITTTEDLIYAKAILDSRQVREIVR